MKHITRTRQVTKARPQESEAHVRRALAALVWCAALAGSSLAQGISPLGASGGLVVPKARPMPEGTIEASVSNLPEPGLQGAARQRSIVLGFGVLPGVEVSGRFAEYATRVGGSLIEPGSLGISDLSLNAKVGWAWGDGPTDLRLGAGVLDFGGQATNFRTGYVVGTQAFGPWDLTLGVGKSDARLRVPGQKRALDGAFGSLSLEVASDKARWGRVELVAEHDARQPLLGARWASPTVEWLAGAQVTGALHRSLAQGAAHPAASVWTLGLSWPLAEREKREHAAEPPAASVAGAAAVPQAALESPTARLGRLKEALQQQGLELVRVGRLADGTWVVQYQNRRFGQNEVDALGVVTGLAVQAAPEDLKSLVVMALKQGQPVLTLRTEPGVWRNFLRNGLPGLARGLTQVQRGDGLQGKAVDWMSDELGGASRAQLQLSPELAYTIGTEFGMADYSLAARAMVTVPLWRGAQLVVAGQQILTSSRQAEPTGVYGTLRQSEGLHTLALQQSFWWGQRAVFSGSIGRFEFGAVGAEGTALVFVPGRDDVIRLRGRAVDRAPDLPRGADLAGAMSYRWVASPTLSAEVGMQRFTDGGSGPTAVFTRWWGDVGAHLFYRQTEWRKYAGVEFSIPLTPRSVRAVGPVHVQGVPSWTRGVRSMVDNPANFVEPRRARDLQLTWDLETQALNAGRLGPEYVLDQLPRMREAFATYVK
jgi:Exopolysaccharide biosynthesis protein YbjH